MNTLQQTRAIELINKIESLKEQTKPLSEELEKIMESEEKSKLFQDPETKLVYCFVPQEGTYIAFKRFIYQRTKKEGESKGTISMKEAQEAGFTL